IPGLAFEELVELLRIDAEQETDHHDEQGPKAAADGQFRRGQAPAVFQVLALFAFFPVHTSGPPFNEKPQSRGMPRSSLAAASVRYSSASVLLRTFWARPAMLTRRSMVPRCRRRWASRSEQQ